jgi:hypothetical protein
MSKHPYDFGIIVVPTLLGVCKQGSKNNPEL